MILRGGLAGLVALVLLVLFQAGDGDGSDGVSWFGSGSLTGQSRPGHDFGFGGVLRNDGDRSITLRSASFVGDVPPQQGLLRETLVFDLGNAGFGPGGAWWPDEELRPYTRPIDGYVVRPSEEVGLVFVVEIRGAGPMTWTEGTVTYERDGERRSVQGRLGLTLCPMTRGCG
ncbi:hypothetical protein [Nocardioides daejeonensis]|uniref:hypothetical protein n=1 Tax=Nocardioides daejeonensis TaxID=1046556 RepID=UPI000D746D89|nr:hypothetical protein [Nocardioides daejeonensis]